MLPNSHPLPPPAPYRRPYRCHRVRDGALVELGVRLEDRPDGSSVWKPEDPAVLRGEAEERRRGAAEARGKKLRSQWEAKRKASA